MESKIILFDFFHIIWQKSPYLRNMTIRIPDTVYIDDEPSEWYFTNKNGKIRKKLREKVTKQNIYKHFLKKSKGSDIIATFISTKKYSISSKDKSGVSEEGFIERKWAKYSKKDQPEMVDKKVEKENNATIVIEYFNKKGLKNFLSNLPSNQQIVGILQSTVRPNGLYNSTIRMVWSPNITIFEKRANLKPFGDKAFPLKERMITFDGPDYYSQQVNLNSKKVHDEINQLMDKLKLHFKGIMMNKCLPSNMIIYFRQDERNRIVMLFCSAIKFQGIRNNIKIKNKIEEKIHDHFCLPDDSKAKFTIIKPKCSSDNRFSVCLDCMKKSNYGELFKLKYSLIVKRYEAEKLKIQKSRKPNQFITKYDTEGNVIIKTKEYMLKHDEAIPKMFKKIYPDMKYKEYQENIQLEEFLDKNVMLCYECLIPYMDFYEQEGGDVVCNLKRVHPHKGRIYKVGDMDCLRSKARRCNPRKRYSSKKIRRFGDGGAIESKSRLGFSRRRQSEDVGGKSCKLAPLDTTGYPTTAESKKNINGNDISRPNSSSLISITRRYRSFEATFGVLRPGSKVSLNKVPRRSRIRINSSNPMKSYYRTKHDRTQSANKSFQRSRITPGQGGKEKIGNLYKIQQEFVQKINSLVKNRNAVEKKKMVDSEKKAGFFKRKKTTMRKKLKPT